MQSCLAGFTFDTISKQTLDNVNTILRNKDLENYIEVGKESELVLDLYTWLQYVPVGYEKIGKLKKTIKDLD